jgi:hypothetical protein
MIFFYQIVMITQSVLRLFSDLDIYPKKNEKNELTNCSSRYLSFCHSNVAEEEIAKQFPTEHREVIICAIPWQKSGRLEHDYATKS